MIWIIWCLFYVSDDLVGIDALMKANPAQAKLRLEKAAENKETRPRAVHLLAILCNRTGDIPGALTYGKQAVTLLPETSDAWLQYAVAMRNKFSQSTWYAMTHADDYRANLSRALALDPNNEAAWHERIAYLMHAPAIAGGSKRKAHDALAELTALNKGAAHFPAAMLLTAEQKHGEALEHYRKAVLHNPHNTSAHFGEAFALVQLGRYQEATPVFEAIYQEDSGQMSALFEAAKTRYLGQFELEKALTQFDTFAASCRKGNPQKTAEAHYHRGLVLEALKRPEEAMVAYTQCLAIDHSFKVAKRAVRRLKRSR